ncbi:MAG: small subunit ribosomal protein S4 [Candidatus Berkelbacteria bacterium Licking1014_2]|uniref:Small ribosomal subunit protein uS4 n=1 Tax=Candidatus Berkelbacteria bacterium Licking1014_2 TaxID=2017146 RepID=A0A554LWI4_9BACT|nr:MAG: small subunit ribosomal protein S4 [Candidatus Berkelbacteria bacterium Licking1014_2]
MTKGAVCRQCRRFGVKLFFKGERCLTTKCSFTRRSYIPGQHGPSSRRKPSEYGRQLSEKQKAKAIYGLGERQFRRLFRQAAKDRQNTGQRLIIHLEKRLDNVVYRLGWTTSRRQARQMISHKKIKLNDKIANIPSLEIKIGDKINYIGKKPSTTIKTELPKWLILNKSTGLAEIKSEIKGEDLPTEIDANQIVEFYSR